MLFRSPASSAQACPWHSFRRGRAPYPAARGALPGGATALFEHKFGCSSTSWHLRSNVPARSDKTGQHRPGGNLAYATRVRSGPELRELSAEQFADELDALAGIYALAMAAPAAELPGRISIMERHARHQIGRAHV